MVETTSIAQTGIRTGLSYNQILRLILVRQLRGWQDERARWRVLEEDVRRLELARSAKGLQPKTVP
jgi:hypothetical protein